MIPFAKAHACGNDFLVVLEKFAGADPAGLARHLCDRTRGIGADGVEFFNWTSEGKGRIRLYNADGSMAEISGNGTRCVAAWMAREANAGEGDDLLLETDAGLRICHIVSRTGHRFLIASRMGIPEIRKQNISLADGRSIEGSVVSTGNPHFVIRVEKPDFLVEGRTWQSVGEEIAHHADFPRQTNVEFVFPVSGNEIEIRIFERGVGPTSSSGTGTCASASAAVHLWGASRELNVVAPGGTQTVEWQGEGSEILLTGPAELICDGEAY